MWWRVFGLVSENIRFVGDLGSTKGVFNFQHELNFATNMVALAMNQIILNLSSTCPF